MVAGENPISASSTGEGFHNHGAVVQQVQHGVREINDTQIMKARPLTSTRLASKSHFGGSSNSSSSQHFGATAGSQTLKVGRQVFNNKTLEATSQHPPSMVQMKSPFGRINPSTSGGQPATVAAAVHHQEQL